MDLQLPEPPSTEIRRDVFQINDIDLIVPPTSIDIQQEDLLYNWRTLRTKASTKIPTGHGQIKIHVTILFTNAMILDLHRLIVQFRHSPFCYIKNKYIRSTIIPDWPVWQNMAFTLTSINVTPMRGTSDTWVCELDLLWFNYLPFAHNYLFREDWNTNWLVRNGQLSKEGRVKLSIGWDLDAESFKRTPRPTVIAADFDPNNEGGVPLTWSSLDNGYKYREQNTIFDMERLHFGDSFDILPLPGNMELARPASNPMSSRIYTRFINYLQRDALIKNFGINPETDLGELSPAFFGVVDTQEGLRTYGLHNGPLEDESIRSRWKSLMLLHNGGVDFHFHVFNSIRLPSEWTDVTAKAKKDISTPKGQAPSPLSTATGDRRQGSLYTLQALDANGNPKGAPIPVRAGWWDPIGKFVPVGNSYSATEPMTIAEVRKLVKDQVELRNQNYYKQDSSMTNGGHAVGEVWTHNGTDISVPIGTPIFAVADGKVSSTKNGFDGVGTSWQYWDTKTNKRADVSPDNPEIFGDWDLSLKSIWNRNGEDLQRIGTFVRSIGVPSRVYFSNYDNKAGQQIAIRHTTGISYYYHVSEIDVSPGTDVKAGQKIGRSGATSTLEDDFVRMKANELLLMNEPPRGVFMGQVDMRQFNAEPNPDYQKLYDENPYALNPHLHFEYREDASLPPPNSSQVTSFAPAVGNATRGVLINPVPSWEAAIPQNVPDIREVSYAGQTQARLDQRVENGEISADVAQSVTDLLRQLTEAGWVYYGDLANVPNVWHKYLKITVPGPQGPGPGFDNRTINVASVSGGMRHVVANIPLLSHEYPTQQHLGSMEPMYSFDFSLRDNVGDLESIPEIGKSIQGMRNLLQKNARSFRPIPDAWCAATDSFITRLFGSFNHNDVKALPISTRGFDGESGLLEFKLTKRSSMTRSGAGTVEGQPGLSFISLEVQETNPFDFEKIKPTAVKRTDMDAARQEVLQRLYSLEFLDKNAKQLLALLLAKSAGGTINPTDPAFGKFAAPTFTRASLSAETLGQEINVAVVYPDNPDNQRTILIRDDLGIYEALLESIAASSPQDAKLLEQYKSNLAGFVSVPESFLMPGAPTTNTQSTTTPPSNKVSYDLSNFLLSDSDTFEIDGVDYTKLLKFYKLVHDSLHIAERHLAEHSSKAISVKYDTETGIFNGDGGADAEGLEDSVISSELFGLPFEAKMWRSWQAFVLAEAERQAGPEAREHLLKAKGWPVWKSDIDAVTKSEAAGASAYGTVSDLWYAPTDTATRAVQELAANTNFAFMQASFSNNSILGSDFASMRFTQVSLLTNRYMTSFPLEVMANDNLDSFGFSSLFGNMVGSSKENKPRAFENFSENLTRSISESGYFVPNLVSRFLGATFTFNNESQLESPVPGAVDSPSAKFSTTSFLSLPELFQGGLSQVTRTPTPQSADLLNTLRARTLASPHFSWVVNRQAEILKVEFFKKGLAQIAELIMEDPTMLELLGLIGLIDELRRGQLVGSEAYPDLELPFHPFFGDTLSVDPDFFMWNIYEDGGALSEEMQDLVHVELDNVISNCYQSMKKMEQGQIVDPTRHPLILEPAVDGNDQLKMLVKFGAEGTDTGAFGPMDSPFYPLGPAQDGVASWESKVPAIRKLQKEQAEAPPGSSTATPSGTTVASRVGTTTELTKTKTSVRVSATEGYFGQGRGVQYPARFTTDQYKDLLKKVRDTESMFGTRKGFRQENLLIESAPNIRARLQQTNLDRIDEFAHMFDVGQLKRLAIDSSKDIISQKMTLKRAFPTFKLFFVEEDEFESRVLNFDDFFSYNAVQSFYVELSRKMPADHAIITIQNVSGSLDGSKQKATTDLDFFLKNPKVPGDASALSGDVLNKDTASDQPFEAVVLRPGLNVQLRVGYANDPDNLHVMLSGRVVDVQWNKSGDLAEIMVQSFGTELIQAIKGTEIDGTSEVFEATHLLLGHLMLEPEIVHFGRWEIGQLYQIGESKDSRIDVKDYGRDGKYGKIIDFISVWNWASQENRVQRYLFAGITGNYLTFFDLDEKVRIIWNWLFGSMSQRIKNWTNVKKASLFISPQDDNLFPPHPKDYMKFNLGFWENAGALARTKFVNLLGPNTASAIVGDTIGRLVTNGLAGTLYDKRVEPMACKYRLLSTTTWQVFHEMSLRHPGWIYGPRPYGNDFRYTMFFGVPSQRYWARGASNSFIKRVNDLNKFLMKSQQLSPAALEAQYKKLYGDQTPEGLTVEQLKQEIQYGSPAEEISAALLPQSPNVDDQFFSESSPWQLEEPPSSVQPPWWSRRNTRIFPIITAIPNDASAAAMVDADLLSQQESSNSETEKQFQLLLQARLTGPAIREYLRALNLRFIPFRRYHIFSSERDIVWNGLMSAENAVTNAVDVTYFNPVNDLRTAESTPLASAVFKAHTFIPEYQLRTAPVRWPNCLGYPMAMRYGMGELIHRMKDMYRGEIIILGNARVRPWDIGILIDSYNDMVGPVEVEQVVHSFSHETGFITEIKPSAVVIGNEISSWPILEAMKTFSLAIKDIENNYTAIRGEVGTGVPEAISRENVGMIREIPKFFDGWSNAELDELVRERNAGLLADRALTLETAVFDGAQPNIPGLDTLIYGAQIGTQAAIAVSGLPIGLVGGTAAGAAGGAAVAGTAAGTVVGTADAIMGGLIGLGLGGPFAVPAGTAVGAGAGGSIGTLAGAAIGAPLGAAGGAIAGPWVGLAASTTVAKRFEFPSQAWLIGGPILFLQCLRQDSIIVVPLIKSGTPIVSGLSYHDPSMIWSHFRGNLRLFVDDILDGTRDMLGEFGRVGTHIWSRVSLSDITSFLNPFTSAEEYAKSQDMSGVTP